VGNRQNQSSLRNCSGVSPAPRTITSIVLAFTGVMAGNGHNQLAIGHDDVFTLASDPKPRPLQRPYGAQVGDSRDCHRLPYYGDFSSAFFGYRLLYNLKIFADAVLDVLQRFLFGLPLGSTAG
jgi:hypothetical protein